MADSVFMAELSWPEFAARAKAGAIVILPLGATEQHGPHLAMSVDVVLPTAVAERVAKKIGALVAPTIPYGYKSQPRSGGGEAFPGTTSLDANTFSLVVRDVIRGLGHHGIRKIVVLNGHFENSWPAVEGLDLGLRELRRDGVKDMQAMRLEYWDFVKRATLDKLFPEGFPGTELEHASLLETSLMLLLRPELVDMSKVPDDGPAKFPTYDRHPVPENFVPASGVLARAEKATAEKGQWLMDDHVELIVAAIKKELARERAMSISDFQPLNSGTVPRFAGPSTFMRLPIARPDEVDVALIGIPFDGGTTNRTGARHGPREIRNQSSLVRRVHHVTGVSPFDLMRVADCGDVPVNPLGLDETLDNITRFFTDVRSAGTTPLTAGGDHLISLPILRGLAREAPLGMIHFDAHSDTYDSFFGSRYNHGTPFRRAIEENLLDPKRVIQIGIRGAISDAKNYDFAKSAGVRIVFIEEFEERGAQAVMEGARAIVGDKPIYVSFDIDVLDPSVAPGTGTPEIGGITSREAQKLIRALAGLDIVGADLVEVSPPLDPTGGTALTAATLMFELLCVLAGARAKRTATD